MRRRRQKGLITASAGNHAQGVAYAAKLAGIKATIVMPTTTPLIKVNRTKGYGAEVVLDGDVFDEACGYALQAGGGERPTPLSIRLTIWTWLPAREPLPWRSSRNCPTVDYILVPIGGGGLCTGVSTLAKLLNPKIKVIGVEPAGANCMQESLRPGQGSHPSDGVNTIADGTAVKTPGRSAVPLYPGKCG